MNRSIILLVVIAVTVAIGISYSCSTNTEDPSNTAYPADNHAAQFVGDQTCASCHAAETISWKGSHYDYAMKEATEQSVRADLITHPLATTAAPTVFLERIRCLW